MAYEYEFIKHIEGTNFKTFFTSISRRLHHWHYDMELLLIIEGSVAFNTAEKQYILKKDDLFLINRNEIHSLTRTKEANTILAIQIYPRFCREYFPKMQRVKFLKHHIQNSLYPDCWKEVRKCLTEIVMAYYKKEDGYQFKLMSILNMLLYHLLQYVPYEYVEEDKIFAEEKNLERLNRIINYIQENYMYKISLKELAASENLDMYYLSHLIKRNLGISFQQYLNKIRLEKAVELFTSTNRKSLDVCIESGFSDYRYLSKMFIKEYGCTPSQYKSQYKNIETGISSSDNEDQHIIYDQNEALEKLIQYLGM